MSTLNLQECKATKEWIDRLNEDDELAYDAIQLWTDIAVALDADIYQTEALRRELPNRRQDCVIIPAHFDRLTELLIAYCRNAFPNIDPGSLKVFVELACAFVLPWRRRGTNLSPDILQQSLLQCVGLLKELWAAIRKRAEPPSVQSLIDAVRPRTVLGETEICQPQPPATPNSSLQPPLPAAKSGGVYGVRVDRESRRIGRDGFEGVTISLANRDVLWHIFIVHYDAGRERVTMAKLRNGYPGEWDDNARSNAYHQLRRVLRPLQITLENRCLKEIAES